MLVVLRQEAKEEQEDIIGPVAVADSHLFTLPAYHCLLAPLVEHDIIASTRSCQQSRVKVGSVA